MAITIGTPATDTTGTIVSVDVTYGTGPSSPAVDATKITFRRDHGTTEVWTETCPFAEVNGAPVGSVQTFDLHLPFTNHSDSGTLQVDFAADAFTDDDENSTSDTNNTVTNNSTTARPDMIARYFHVERASGERVPITPTGGPCIDNEAFKVRIIAGHMDDRMDDAGNSITPQIKFLCGGNDTPTDPSDDSGWISMTRVSDLAPVDPDGNRHSERGAIKAGGTYADVVWEASLDSTNMPDTGGGNSAASNGWFECYLRGLWTDGSTVIGDGSPSAVGESDGAHRIATGDEQARSWIGRGYMAGSADTFCDVYYAYVDTVSGDDSTGVASMTAATAKAAPFKTAVRAANGIQDQRNSDNGDQNADNGIVRIIPVSGGLEAPSYLTTADANRTRHCWLTYELHEDYLDDAGGRFTSQNGTARTSLCRFKGIDLDFESFTQISGTGGNGGYNYSTNADQNKEGFLWLDQLRIYGTAKTDSVNIVDTEYKQKWFCTNVQLGSLSTIASARNYASFVDGLIHDIGVDSTADDPLVVNRRIKDCGTFLARITSDDPASWDEATLTLTHPTAFQNIDPDPASGDAQFLPTGGTNYDSSYTSATAPDILSWTDTSITLSATIVTDGGDPTDIIGRAYLKAHGDTWQTTSVTYGDFADIIRIHDRACGEPGDGEAMQGKGWQNGSGTKVGLLEACNSYGSNQYHTQNGSVSHYVGLHITHNPYSIAQGSSNANIDILGSAGVNARITNSIIYESSDLYNSASSHAMFDRCNFRDNDIKGTNGTGGDPNLADEAPGDGDETEDMRPTPSTQTATALLSSDISGNLLSGSVYVGATGVLGVLSGFEVQPDGRTATFTASGMDHSLITGFESGKTLTVEVTTEGYTSGVLGTSTRTIKCKFNSVADSGADAIVTVGLADPVHDDDVSATFDASEGLLDDGTISSLAVVDGAVTQSSTLDYPRSVVRIVGVLQNDVPLGYKDPLDTGDFVVEVMAICGKDPIDSVDITVTDGVSPQTTNVTAWSLSPYTGTTDHQQSVPVLSATFAASDFADGDLTITATAYPGRGDADSVKTDTETVYNDAAGGLTDTVVYVATTGNNSTGDGSSGNPYLTCNRAYAHIAQDGAEATSRWVVEIMDAGTHDFPGADGANDAKDVACAILTRKASGLTRAQVILKTTTDDFRGTYARMEGFTVDVYHTGTAPTRLDGRVSAWADASLTWYDCIVNGSIDRATGTASNSTWYRNFDKVYHFGSEITDINCSPASNNASRGRNCKLHITAGDAAQNSLWFVGSQFDDMTTGTGHPDTFQVENIGTDGNRLYAYNTIKDVDHQAIFDSNGGPEGRVAFVFNTVIQRDEGQYSSQLGPTTAVGTTNYDSWTFAHNTMLNQRFWTRDFDSSNNVYYIGNAARDMLVDEAYGLCNHNHSLSTSSPTTPGFDTSDGAGDFVGGGLYDSNYSAGVEDLTPNNGSPLLGGTMTAAEYLIPYDQSGASVSGSNQGFVGALAGASGGGGGSTGPGQGGYENTYGVNAPPPPMFFRRCRQCNSRLAAGSRACDECGALV